MARSNFYLNPQVQIPPLSQCRNFAVGDGAFEHPKAAVWVDEADAVGSGGSSGGFYAAGDLFGRLDVVDFDVDYANAEADARVDVLQGAQVARRAVGEFEH